MSKSAFVLVLILFGSASGQWGPPPCYFNPADPVFVRGDVDAGGVVDFQDFYFLQSFLYYGSPTPACLASADVNDDESVDFADLSYLLYFLFANGPAPPAPFPCCGVDPTPSSLTCETHSCQEI